MTCLLFIYAKNGFWPYSVSFIWVFCIIFTCHSKYGARGQRRNFKLWIKSILPMRAWKVKVLAVACAWFGQARFCIGNTASYRILQLLTGFVWFWKAIRLLLLLVVFLLRSVWSSPVYDYVIDGYSILQYVRRFQCAVLRYTERCPFKGIRIINITIGNIGHKWISPLKKQQHQQQHRRRWKKSWMYVVRVLVCSASLRARSVCTAFCAHNNLT